MLSSFANLYQRLPGPSFASSWSVPSIFLVCPSFLPGPSFAFSRFVLRFFQIRLSLLPCSSFASSLSANVRSIFKFFCFFLVRPLLCPSSSFASSCSVLCFFLVRPCFFLFRLSIYMVRPLHYDAIFILISRWIIFSAHTYTTRPPPPPPILSSTVKYIEKERGKKENGTGKKNVRKRK